MKKKLLSLLALVALVSSCGTTQKTVSSHKPIVSRVPEKVLTESKRSETYINKEVPETPEELKATSAVKVTPALIREYINTYKDPCQYYLSPSHLGEWLRTRTLGTPCS